CADDNELSENQVWSLGRADFDYCAPRAYRNVNEVLSAYCALARDRAGVLLRRGGHIDVSHDDLPSESRSVEVICARAAFRRTRTKSNVEPDKSRRSPGSVYPYRSQDAGAPPKS